MNLYQSLLGPLLVLLIFASPPVLATSLFSSSPEHSQQDPFERDLLTSTVQHPVSARSEALSPLASPATPCSGTDCASPPTLVPDTTLPCEAVSGITLTVASPGGAKYIITCDVDYPDQNIYPFVPAGSFGECLTQCEIHNQGLPNGDVDDSGSRCVGFVFAPDRVHDPDNCYLKSSLEEPIPATIHLVGATTLTAASSTRCTTETTSS